MISILTRPFPRRFKVARYLFRYPLLGPHSASLTALSIRIVNLIANRLVNRLANRIVNGYLVKPVLPRVLPKQPVDHPVDSEKRFPFVLVVVDCVNSRLKRLEPSAVV